MAYDALRLLGSQLSDLRVSQRLGRVVEVARGVLTVHGLADCAGLGDRIVIRPGGSRSAAPVPAEIIGLGPRGATLMSEGSAEGVRIGDPVEFIGPSQVAPDDSWIGRIVDAFGRPLDGAPLMKGERPRPLVALPPPATRRRRLGHRLETRLAVFDTMLPLVRGQRIGLFAGSGVGKSRLLGELARGVDSEVVVIALVGERGRELRAFVEDTLGVEGAARAVVVAATSDQSALARRRCAWTAMAVAEHFRDAGRHVLLLADSVTRFAEAHREIALASGEPASLRGYPPSTSHQIMTLAERAGPGPEGGTGDITAVFTVLVAGSDMEEPVADILRGVLDGHVVMDRTIAERGRFPAIDLLRSVSRSLPEAASADENQIIAQARGLLGAYERAEMMIQSGLYVPGSDPMVDRAARIWPALDAFVSEPAPEGVEAAFRRLAEIVQGEH